AGATGERLDWFLHLVHELPGPAADPLSAARVRLRNLGYRPGPLDDPSLDAATLEALRAFQRDNGLAITLDHETPDFADVIRIYGR
ncbi:MAG: peptidoglycan-binding domain-containing protein, partial [Myxococcota bacterium]